MDAQQISSTQISNKATGADGRQYIRLVGLPGSGKTVLLLGLFQHATSLNADNRLRYEGSNDAARTQLELFLKGRFPEQKKQVEDFELEIDRKPIVFHCEPGETASNKGGGELTIFLKQHFCIWVQNPFLLDADFSTVCFLGLIARFQANNSFVKEEVVNLIDLVAEAMFSWRNVEDALEKTIADTMEMKNPVTWRTVYEAFKCRGGVYAITVELKAPVIDPFENIEKNFGINTGNSVNMPSEADIFGLIKQLISQILDSVRPNLRKAGGALTRSPKTPIVMSHMDIVYRAGVIFAESKLRQLCVPWLGVESLDERRAIYAEPLIKTRIQPEHLVAGLHHVRPIEFVTPATEHIFNEAILTWRTRAKQRVRHLLSMPALSFGVGAIAGALLLATVFGVVDAISRGQSTKPPTAPAQPAPATPAPAAPPAQGPAPPAKAPAK